MKLSERIFTTGDFQKITLCGISCADHFPNDWSGTLEEGLCVAKACKTLDYWNFYWVAMQFFDERQCRILAMDCAVAANLKYPLRNERIEKSAVAILNKNPHKSCPMVLLKLREIVGNEYLDKLVCEAIRNHP